MKTCLNIFILLSVSFHVYSQDSIGFLTPATQFNSKRYADVICLEALGYGGSLDLLSMAWYNGYKQTSFHLFNDGEEWLQMDKCGHFLTNWYLGRIGIDMAQWSGMENKKAIRYGIAAGYIYMTGLEVLDGYSSGWGFSLGDFAANTLGATFIAGQKFIQVSGTESHLLNGIGGISLKFSYAQTNFPQYRPVLLGTNLAERIIKDYNGQSYWLSFNLSSFMSKSAKFPKWLNIALGYGAEGMISGHPGYQYMDANGNTIEFERYRQYYFSLDIDLTKIKTRSHLLKTIFETFSFLKIPAPALEFNQYGMKFHPAYY